MRNPFIAALCILAISSPVLASEYVDTSMSTTQFDALSHNKRDVLANMFNLNQTEYRKYLHYINETYDGVAYQKNTNPNLILAMHETNQTKYEHYLKNAVKADHDAIAALLKVSRDYTQTAKDLYPNEKPVITKEMRANIQHWLQPGDTVQLYCDIQKLTCSHLLSLLMPAVLAVENAQLDIFAVGENESAKLFNFAKANSIDPKLVKAHRITLNLYKNKDEKLLPQVAINRNGRSMFLSLGGGHDSA